MNPFARFLATLSPFTNLGVSANKLKGLFRFFDSAGSSISSALKGLGPQMGNHLQSFLNSVSGAHMTQSEVEANELQMQNVEDMYGRQVAGMQKSGLNPALMYDKGASGSVPQVSGSPGSGSMSDLMSLITLPLQLKMLKSDIALKRSQSDVNEAQAKSIGVQTDFAERTFELRTKALELANELSRADKDLIYTRKDEAMANIRKIDQEALTEESKRALNEAQSLLYRCEAQDIIMLQPYKIQLLEAQTSAEKAQASLCAVQELYQRHLIDSGYVDALCRQMEASASSSESKQVLDGITSRLRSGTVLQPADFGDSRVMNILEQVYNGMVTESVNNGLAVVTNLLNYLPNFLVGFGGTQTSVSSGIPLIYGPNGETVSRVNRLTR